MWKWKEEQQKTFQELKSKLINPPIFKQADGMKPIFIKTGACNVAIGAVPPGAERRRKPHRIYQQFAFLVRQELFDYRKRSSCSSVGTQQISRIR